MDNLRNLALLAFTKVNSRRVATLKSRAAAEFISTVAASLLRSSNTSFQNVQRTNNALTSRGTVREPSIQRRFPN